MGVTEEEVKLVQAHRAVCSANRENPCPGSAGIHHENHRNYPIFKGR
jgi:hypothetical protein